MIPEVMNGWLDSIRERSHMAHRNSSPPFANEATRVGHPALQELLATIFAVLASRTVVRNSDRISD
jgi:hypothetical protein